MRPFGLLGLEPFQFAREPTEAARSTPTERVTDLLDVAVCTRLAPFLSARLSAFPHVVGRALWVAVPRRAAGEA